MIYLGSVLAAVGVVMAADVAFWPVLLVSLGGAIALSTLSPRQRRHNRSHRRHRGESQGQQA